MIAVGAKGFAQFDRSVLRVRWRKINESPAKKAGLYVRKIAIRSIRRDRSKSGNRPSKPGKPPRTRSPGDPLRRIYSVPQVMDVGVIVGPLGFGDPRPVTELHEFGGARTGVFKRRKSGIQRRGRGGRLLKQETVMERTTVRYPARPYMGPALDKSIPRLPSMWRGSVGG